MNLQLWEIMSNFFLQVIVAVYILTNSKWERSQTHISPKLILLNFKNFWHSDSYHGFNIHFSDYHRDLAPFHKLYCQFGRMCSYLLIIFCVVCHFLEDSCNSLRILLDSCMCFFYSIARIFIVFMLPFKVLSLIRRSSYF